MLRESGLPTMVPDPQGQNHLGGWLSKAVVRAVYPALWRVDLEPEDGGTLHKALVLGPYFPEVHADGAPSMVFFTQVRQSAEDIVCWPVPHRRFLGPREGQGDAEERHYYHRHRYIERSGDIIVRITTDNRWIIEDDKNGDYLEYKQDTREVRVIAPSVYLGTRDASRIEYQEADVVNVVMPDIRLGTPQANQQVILGNLWRTFYNTFVRLFNNHQHVGVASGGSVTGPPVQRTLTMSTALLSDVTRTTKGASGLASGFGALGNVLSQVSQGLPLPPLALQDTLASVTDSLHGLGADLTSVVGSVTSQLTALVAQFPGDPLGTVGMLTMVLQDAGLGSVVETFGHLAQLQGLTMLTEVVSSLEGPALSQVTSTLQGLGGSVVSKARTALADIQTPLAALPSLRMAVDQLAAMAGEVPSIGFPVMDTLALLQGHLPMAGTLSDAVTQLTTLLEAV